MTGFAIFSQLGIFDFHKVANLAASSHNRARPDARKWTDVASPRTAHIFQYAIGMNTGASRQLAILENTAGTDLNTIAQLVAALEYDVDVDKHVVASVQLPANINSHGVCQLHTAFH